MTTVYSKDSRLLPEQEHLVESHVAVARSVALAEWRKAPPGALELGELEGIANVALVQCAARWETYCENNSYDPARTEYFTAFAVRRMRGAIIDVLRASHPATRVQRSRVKLIREANGNETLTETEIVARTGLSSSEIRDAIAAVNIRNVPLEAGESHPDEISGPSFLLDVAVRHVSSLSQQIQVVLALRYYVGLEFRAIAKVLQLSDSEVSRCHAEGVLSLLSECERVLAA